MPRGLCVADITRHHSTRAPLLSFCLAPESAVQRLHSYHRPLALELWASSLDVTFHIPFFF